MSLLKLDKKVFILLLFAVLFTVIYFWMVTPIAVNVNVGPRFDWPDETANYFWSTQYAQTGELSVYEPLNLTAQNQIHPRSINVRSDGSLVPGSFVGIILFFGTLAKIYGTDAMIYFTPFLAILGVLAFYGIIKRIFNAKIALISSILLFFHPAWWYYSVTSMLPNIAFISLILLSIYFLFQKENISTSHIFLSSIFAGLAILIRPAEIIWVAIIYLVILLHQRQKLSISKFVLFGAIICMLILPSFYYQSIIYGDFFATGYSQLQNTTTAASQIKSVIKSLVIPFGFSFKNIVNNLWTHYIYRLWWFSILCSLGFVLFLTKLKKQSKKRLLYVLIYLFLLVWLGMYYGSWEFSDKLTVQNNTLGLSYVRYFLPIFILSLPFVAIALLWLSNFFKERWQKMALSVFMILLFYPSANLVLFTKPDSIMPVKARIASYKLSAQGVISKTQSNSVIITNRKDKVFFPERKVIHTFLPLHKDKNLLDILPKLIEQTSVYYYALEPQKDLQLNDGIELVTIKNIGEEVLYQIKKINAE